MSLVLETTPIPLEQTNDGVILVSGTRISLDVIVEAFQDGATPEEIVVQYNSLTLPIVYSVISYYLQHITAVEKYLKERRKQAAKTKKLNESRANSQGLRARLLARQK